MKSLEEIIQTEVSALNGPGRTLAPGECRSGNGTPCGLCHAMTLDYPRELAIKEQSFARFWSDAELECAAEPLVPSPRGRAYRTLSKRKVFAAGHGVRLGLIGPSDHPRAGGIPVVRCAIEPPEHAAVYATHDAVLNTPWCAPLREQLTYVVLKGDYRRLAVIWNVRNIPPALVRSANTLSKLLTRAHGSLITGLFLYRGDDDGRYYLGARDPGAKPDLRKLHGKPDIATTVGGRPFLYPPLAFSQVNGSMMVTFVSRVRALLEPRREETLYDLYCGYGLFALSLAGDVRRVVGAEMSATAIAAAKANAENRRVRNCRFVRVDLTAEAIPFVMGDDSSPSVVILDPPRKGTGSGVIEAIAARRPSKVLHIFCNSDLIVPDLRRWNSRGYRALRAVPLDMFPGTPEVETLVLLKPADQGKTSRGMS